MAAAAAAPASAVALAAGSALAAAPAATPWWSAALSVVNSSPAAWGVAALVVNLGSRYVASDFLSPEQQSVLSRPLMRRIVLFFMAFLVTHNVLLSVALSTAVVVLVEGLLRPTSRFCMLSMLGGCKPGAAGTGDLADAATASQGGGSHAASNLAHAAISALARLAEPRRQRGAGDDAGAAWRREELSQDGIIPPSATLPLRPEPELPQEQQPLQPHPWHPSTYGASA